MPRIKKSAVASRPTTTDAAVNQPLVNIPMPAALNVRSGDMRANFQAFEFAWTNYRIASGLDSRPDVVQLITLVCALGEPAQQLYMQLELSDEQRSTVAGTLSGLRLRLCGADNMRLDRRLFNRAKQRSDETYLDYFERLRTLLRRCQFGGGEVDDDFLLDRILCSIQDKWQARRMMSTRNLTLDQAITWCRRHEKLQLERQRAAGNEHTMTASISKASVATLATSTTTASAAPRTASTSADAPPTYSATMSADANASAALATEEAKLRAELQRRQIEEHEIRRLAEQRQNEEIEALRQSRAELHRQTEERARISLVAMHRQRMEMGPAEQQRRLAEELQRNPIMVQHTRQSGNMRTERDRQSNVNDQCIIA